MEQETITVKSPTSKSELSKPHGRKKFKRACCLIVGVSVIFISCSSIFAFLWTGGWVKHYTCKVVRQDSLIWNKFTCSSNNVVDNSNVVTDQISEESKTIIKTEENAIIDVVDKASPAVVSVAIMQQSNNPFQDSSTSESNDIGTGFIVRSDGVILTNQHVVSQTDAEYNVFIQDKTEPYKVQKIYRDSANDIALLIIDATDLPTLELGDSDDLKVGQLVIAIGNPLGNRGTVTTGIISGLHREVSVGDSSQTFFYQGKVKNFNDVIQTDAAVNPGNSGGPLLNSSGVVIGINFATSGYDNISFALPINQVKTKLDEFDKLGKFSQPYLGVKYNVISEYDAYFYENVVPGALITEVLSGSPAEKAGLKAYDIVTEINNESVGADLATTVQEHKVGDILTLKIWRDKAYKEINVTLEEVPD